MNSCALLQAQLQPIRALQTEVAGLMKQLLRTGTVDLPYLKSRIAEIAKLRSEYMTVYQEKVTELLITWYPHANTASDRADFLRNLAFDNNGRVSYTTTLRLQNTNCTYIPSLFRSFEQLYIPAIITEIAGVEKIGTLIADLSKELSLPKLETCDVLKCSADKVSLPVLKKGKLTFNADNLERLILPAFIEGNIQANAKMLEAPLLRAAGHITLLGENIKEVYFPSLEKVQMLSIKNHIINLLIPRLKEGLAVIRSADVVDMNTVETYTGDLRMYNIKNLFAARLKIINGEADITGIHKPISEVLPLLESAGDPTKDSKGLIIRDDQKKQIDALVQEGKLTLHGKAWIADLFPGKDADYDTLLLTIMDQLRQSDRYDEYTLHDMAADRLILKANALIDVSGNTTPITDPKITSVPITRSGGFSLYNNIKKPNETVTCHFHTVPLQEVSNFDNFYQWKIAVNSDINSLWWVNETDITFAEIDGKQYKVLRPETLVVPFIGGNYANGEHPEQRDLLDSIILKYTLDSEKILDNLIRSKTPIGGIKTFPEYKNGWTKLEHQLHETLQKKLQEYDLPDLYINSKLEESFDIHQFITDKNIPDEVVSTILAELVQSDIPLPKAISALKGFIEFFSHGSISDNPGDVNELSLKMIKKIIETHHDEELLNTNAWSTIYKMAVENQTKENLIPVLEEALNAPNLEEAGRIVHRKR